MPLPSALVALLVVALIVTAVTDLRFNKIFNSITFPVMGIAVLGHTFTAGLDGLFFSGAGLMLGIALLLPLYIVGGMGAGDAKLLGAVGAVVGAEGVAYVAVFTGIYGGFYALILLAVHRDYSRAMLSRGLATLKTFVLTKQYIPAPNTFQARKKPELCYAIAIGLGSMTYLALVHFRSGV